MTTNQLAYWRDLEQKRHNLASERETERSNMARELETARSNRAYEGIGWQNAYIAQQQAQAAQQNADSTTSKTASGWVSTFLGPVAGAATALGAAALTKTAKRKAAINKDLVTKVTKKGGKVITNAVASAANKHPTFIFPVLRQVLEPYMNPNPGKY